MLGGDGGSDQGRGGQSAQAQVVAATPTQVAIGYGPMQVVANTQILWDLKLHVTPQGEAPFEVEIKQLWPQLEAPRVGQVLTVLYDPDDHSKVAIDHSLGAEQSGIASMLESRLGPEQTAALQQLGLGSVGDMLKAAMSDPQGFTARVQERAAATAQAAEAQAEAMTSRLRATQAGGAAPGAAAAAGAAGDPVEELTKLADLRDRGVLTNEEFEKQKKRILGE